MSDPADHRHRCEHDAKWPHKEDGTPKCLCTCPYVDSPNPRECPCSMSRRNPVSQTERKDVEELFRYPNGKKAKAATDGKGLVMYRADPSLPRVACTFFGGGASGPCKYEGKDHQWLRSNDQGVAEHMSCDGACMFTHDPNNISIGGLRNDDDETPAG